MREAETGDPAAERAALIDRYRAGHAAVMEALSGATEQDLDRRPAGGGWSARMVVHHLADSETNSSIRLRRLVAQDAPAMAGYDEELRSRRLHDERPIAPSLTVVAAVRGASLQLLEAMSDEDVGRAGSHSESGRYGVADWLRIDAEHPHEHAARIRGALAGS